MSTQTTTKTNTETTLEIKFMDNFSKVGIDNLYMQYLRVARGASPFVPEITFRNSFDENGRLDDPNRDEYDPLTRGEFIAQMNWNEEITAYIDVHDNQQVEETTTWREMFKIQE